MPRLFIEPDLYDAQRVVLSPEQTHYLSHVMRLETGDHVQLFNGRDGEWEAEIVASGNNKKHGMELLALKQTRQQPIENAIYLTCAPIKKAYFDYMLMKATELGVTQIHPILTTRTQVREVNLDRSKAIMIEAAEQSERLSVPSINEPILLENITKKWPSGVLPLVCAEWGNASPIGKVLQNTPSQPVAIITGPEGGFSSEELDLLRSLPKACAVRLGPRILRADTAAMAALTCWQTLCGDWR